MKLDPAAGVVISVSALLLFGAASVAKWRMPDRFVQTVRAYDVVPQWLATAAAWLLLAAEPWVVLGTVFEATRRAALASAALLLLLYAAAIALNLQRGRRNLDCGCSGSGQRYPISSWMVWRNLAGAATFAVGTLPWSDRHLLLVDFLTVGAATVLVALLYRGSDQLAQIAVRRRIEA